MVMLCNSSWITEKGCQLLTGSIKSKNMIFRNNMTYTEGKRAITMNTESFLAVLDVRLLISAC